MSKQFKIIYVSGALSFGGLERVVINLCKGVNREFFEPVMVCLKSRGELADEIEDAGIKLYNLDANQPDFSMYTTWWRLRHIIKKEKASIVHSHNTAAFLDSVLATLTLPRRILIHTDHARSFPDKLRYMFAERFAACRASKIVAVSDALKSDLMRYEKIPEKKIEVILNGIEEAQYARPVDTSALRKQYLPRKFKHVIGLGVVLSEQKGIIHLIRAATEILNVLPDTCFLIAGDGPARLNLEKEIKQLGLDNNFVFLGFRKDIPELLQLLDIYVFPSEWEGLPLSILEAMAAKRCILSTNVGGIPKALADNKNALLIPQKRPDLIAEKVIRLLNDKTLRRRLADSAYQTFKERFDVKAMIAKYERLYFKVLGR